MASVKLLFVTRRFADNGAPRFLVDVIADILASSPGVGKAGAVNLHETPRTGAKKRRTPMEAILARGYFQRAGTQEVPHAACHSPDGIPELHSILLKWPPSLIVSIGTATR